MKQWSALAAVGFLFIALLPPSVSFGQTKYPVEVLHSGNDRVGTLYAFELREAIRGSHGMHLTEDGMAPRIKVSVVTVDASRSDSGVSSAIAVTILYDSPDVPLGGAHLNTLVQICGRDRATTCARALLSSIDAAVVHLREQSQRLWKTLHRMQ